MGEIPVARYEVDSLVRDKVHNLLSSPYLVADWGRHLLEGPLRHYTSARPHEGKPVLAVHLKRGDRADVTGRLVVCVCVPLLCPLVFVTRVGSQIQLLCGA